MAEQTMVERVAKAISAHVTVNALRGSVPTSHEKIGKWCETMARAAIEAIEGMGYSIVHEHVSHIDAVCPGCGTFGSDHAPGCVVMVGSRKV